MLLSLLSCNEALFAFQIPPLSKGRLGGDCESLIQLKECSSDASLRSADVCLAFYILPSFGGVRGGSNLHTSAHHLHRPYIHDYQTVCKVGADIQIFLKN